MAASAARREGSEKKYNNNGIILLHVFYIESEAEPQKRTRARVRGREARCTGSNAQVNATHHKVQFRVNGDFPSVSTFPGVACGMC